jgi:hypothetical protein
MRNPLGNLVVYYLAVFAPIFFLVFYLLKQPLFNNWLGVFVFLLYAFPYRPIIDFYRLKAKGILGDKDFKKALSPFTSMEYFRELYWF